LFKEYLIGVLGKQITLEGKEEKITIQKE